MLTLMLSLLLKIPADQLEHEGLTLSFVGSCMLAETLSIPGAAEVAKSATDHDITIEDSEEVAH
jgi:hypothetical protein